MMKETFSKELKKFQKKIEKVTKGMEESRRNKTFKEEQDTEGKMKRVKDWRKKKEESHTIQATFWPVQ